LLRKKKQTNPRINTKPHEKRSSMIRELFSCCFVLIRGLFLPSLLNASFPIRLNPRLLHTGLLILSTDSVSFDLTNRREDAGI
jgi:hypothetical protein